MWIGIGVPQSLTTVISSSGLASWFHFPFFTGLVCTKMDKHLKAETNQARYGGHFT
uniref:Uncharacterized protein n=1 Tax=Anguilla anguilla TaxID=7936 RepID=A0A0E9XFV6_ANGAN